MSLTRIGIALSLIASTCLGAEPVLIRVAGDGWTSSISESPKKLDDGDALWSWSAECLPHRMTSLDAVPCASGDAVTIHVAGPRRVAVVSEIRWGTEAMIRDLPDALLPSARTDAAGLAAFRIPKNEIVYARVAGPLLASGWKEIHPGALTITATDAARGLLRVVEEGASAASHARIELRTIDTSQPLGLGFLASGNGLVPLPPLPAHAYVKLLAWSDRGAPVVSTAVTERLPQRITLPAGFAISGKTVDEEKRPVASAAVSALFLVRGEGSSVQKRAASQRDGTWRIEGIPATDVEWNVAREPFAASSHVVRVTGDADTGTTVLWRARDVAVRVTNERGDALAKAKIATSDGVTAVSDARGAAVLQRVPVASFSATASASGYRAATVRIADVVGKPLVIALRRAARLRARIVTAEGKPAGPGSAAVQLNDRKSIVEFDDRGNLAVDDLDGGMVSLEIRADGLAPFHIPPRAIAAGELVDLGAIVLERGLHVVGRAIDGVSGQPLGGVIVRALRPNSFSPILSYVRHDWVSAESAADGTFRIAGLAPGLYSMWTESATHAPLVMTGVTVAAQPGSGETDLGDLRIPAAHLVEVHCEPAARCGSEVSVLLAGTDWLPLRSSLAEGTADIGPVPGGSARLRLSDRRGIIHEREITIADDEPATKITIKLPAVTISGVVTRGGAPVRSGMVTLTNAPDQPSRFVQIATTRGAGTIGNDVIGSIPRQITAPVSQDGRFEFHDASPGDYEAVWSSEGWPSPPRRINVPEASEASIAIDVAAATIAGSIRATDGSVPQRVLVALEQGARRAQTIASADGSFSFLGVEHGPALVRATTVKGDQAERSLTIDDDSVGNVDLILDQKKHQTMSVFVTSRGLPLANTFVFLRSTGGMRAATSGGDGRATFDMSSSDLVIDVAAFSAASGWGFASAPGASSENLAVDIPGSVASLLIRKASGSAPISVQSPSGFPIEEALITLGVAPIAYASAPLRLSGVPAGTYRIVAGGVVRAERVSNGVREVDF